MNSVSWDKILLNQAQSVILWSVTRGYLNYDGIPLYFHTVDRTILLLAAILQKKAKKLAVVYPLNTCNLIAPLAAEILYEVIYEKPRNKVLVITQNIRPRNDFMSFKVNQMVLNQRVFPVAVVRSDRSFSKITKQLKKSNYEKETRLFFSPAPHILPDGKIAGQIRCIIVDTSARYENSSLHDLLQWADENKIPSILFIETNPYSPHIDFFEKHEIPLWGWNYTGLKRDCEAELKTFERDESKYNNPFGASFRHIKNYVEGIKKVYIPIEDENLNSLFLNAQQIYFDLRKVSKGKNEDIIDNAIHDYLVTVYALAGLCVPVDYAENELAVSFPFKTIADRIEMLERYESIIADKDSIIGSFWSKTYDICKEIYISLENSSPKAEMLVQAIEKAEVEEKSILIVMHNNTLKRSVIKFLEEKYGLGEDKKTQNKIDIISIKELADVDRYDIAVFYGQIPFNRIELLRTTNASKLGFLVYEHEKNMLLIQIEKERQHFERLFHYDMIIKTFNKLTDIPTEKIKTMIHPPLGEEKIGIAPELSKEKNIRRDATEISPVFENFEVPDVNLDTYSYTDSLDFLDERDDDIEVVDGEPTVKCMKFILEDGSSLYSKRSKEIPVLAPLREKIDYRRAERIRVNETIVLVNKKNKESLAEMILKVVDEHPSMKRITTLVKSWVYVLQRGMKETGDSLGDILSKMQMRGSKIKTELAIHWWTKQYVIGPADREDIKRIGEIYSNKFLTSNYVDIYAAIRRMRGIHVSLMRKLSQMIPQAGLEAQKKGVDEGLIDKDLNLYIEDFKDMVSFHKVVEVEKDVRVDYFKLNRLIK